MTYFRVAVGAMLAVAAATAMADNFSGPVSLSGPVNDTYTGIFGETHLQPTSFVDTFSITPVPAGVFQTNSAVETINLNLSSLFAIDFSSITLTDANGVLASFVPTIDTPNVFEYWTLPTAMLMSPLTLTLNGVAGNAGAKSNASYSGTINLTSVPEPSVEALGAIGLMVVAFMTTRAKRRQ